MSSGHSTKLTPSSLFTSRLFGQSAERCNSSPHKCYYQTISSQISLLHTRHTVSAPMLTFYITCLLNCTFLHLAILLTLAVSISPSLSTEDLMFQHASLMILQFMWPADFAILIKKWAHTYVNAMKNSTPAGWIGVYTEVLQATWSVIYNLLARMLWPGVKIDTPNTLGKPHRRVVSLQQMSRCCIGQLYHREVIPSSLPPCSHRCTKNETSGYIHVARDRSNSNGRPDSTTGWFCNLRYGQWSGDKRVQNLWPMVYKCYR